MSFENGGALVIGVGHYQDVRILPVPQSVADAQEVKKTLCEPMLCGYPPERVCLLKDETADRDTILAQLTNLAQISTPESTVVIFYCGHGATGTDGNYYLTTHDSRISADRRVEAGTGISDGELIMKLKAIPARGLLFLFNACHSGELSPDLGLAETGISFDNTNIPNKTPEAILGTGTGRIIITACRSDQKSWLGHGSFTIFTQALLEGLKAENYIPNNGGYISVFDLYDHMYSSITEAAAKLGKIQEPELTILKAVGPFPVALYKGATKLEQFDTTASLPQGKAVNQVDEAHVGRALASYRAVIQRFEAEAGGVNIGGAQTAKISGDVPGGIEQTQGAKGPGSMNVNNEQNVTFD